MADHHAAPGSIYWGQPSSHHQTKPSYDDDQAGCSSRQAQCPLSGEVAGSGRVAEKLIVVIALIVAKEAALPLPKSSRSKCGGRSLEGFPFYEWRPAVEITPFEKLQQPDERSLRFSPWSFGGRMRPEDAAAFQQETVGYSDLVPQVCERVRTRFDQVRVTFSYGVLSYSLFTAAHDQAYLTLEFAVRARFLEFYGGAITVVDEGVDRQEAVTTFDEVRGQFQRRRGRSTPKLRLRNGRAIAFDGMLDALMTWARAEDLLNGQRTRHMEPLFRKFRNFVAHEAGDHITTPVNAARAIRDLAETINRLWGVPTPGGRLYPAPIRREPLVLAWSKDERLSSTGPAENAKAAAAEPDNELHVVVLAAAHDDELNYFDARYETSHLPQDLLWGPGTREEAIAWYERERPDGDEVDVLDRLFVLRFYEQRLYLPQQIDIVAGLGPHARRGTWYLARTDSPLDAFNHLRQVLAGGAGNRCSRRGECRQCAVEMIGSGPWEQVVRLLADNDVTPTPCFVPDVRVPSWRPRWNEIIGDGNWNAPTDEGQR
ncbi:hypothetical protein ACFWY5_28200 [Nonomuraea sp. NPDC059007]|uniref:hypothetical protein n=1 Tax=Nonomuraea sp. NPDC059007 TaxID=3346692 RepID=UPI0036B7828A